MKIIHVLNWYLPEHIAGTEVYVSTLVRELKKLDILSKVMIPNFAKTENESYFFEDIEVIKYAEPTLVDRKLVTGQKAPGGLHSFLKILAIEKPDIIHFHELDGSIGIGLFHVKAVKKLGIKSVMTFHLAKYTCKTGTLMYLNETKCDGIISKFKCSDCCLKETGLNKTKFILLKAAYTVLNYLKFDTRVFENKVGTALALPYIILDIKKNLLSLEAMTDSFIVLTDWYKNILLKNGIEESHLSIIYQGLPNSSKKTNKRIKNNKKLQLVYIGRVSQVKGLDLLLLALKDIDQSKVELTIYGNATDQNYMEECLLISSDMKNIFWKGTIEPHLVIEKISQFDVLCIPSAVSEMGPFVLKEAFAAGVPVLASNVYGNAEQITEGINGWLFNFRDITDLKNKIAVLINNPIKILEAAKNISEPRNFDIVALEHKNLYTKVLSKIENNKNTDISMMKEVCCGINMI